MGILLRVFLHPQISFQFGRQVIRPAKLKIQGKSKLHNHFRAHQELKSKMLSIFFPGYRDECVAPQVR